LEASFLSELNCTVLIFLQANSTMCGNSLASLLSFSNKKVFMQAHCFLCNETAITGFTVSNITKQKAIRDLYKIHRWLLLEVFCF
jgi:hypothetical protein